MSLNTFWKRHSKRVFKTQPVEPTHWLISEYTVIETQQVSPSYRALIGSASISESMKYYTDELMPACQLVQSYDYQIQAAANVGNKLEIVCGMDNPSNNVEVYESMLDNITCEVCRIQLKKRTEKTWLVLKL